jgi:hypothetical protein
VVDRHSPSSTLDAEHRPGIAQIGDVADLLVAFLADVRQTASGSRVAGAHKFKLVVSFAQDPSDDSFNIILILRKFLLQNLTTVMLTLGMTEAQNSLTWLPPCPSKSHHWYSYL